MSQPVIFVENLSKAYRLGQIGTGTLTNDLKVWWAKKLGRPNPMLRIGDTDQGNRDGETLWALKDVSFQVEQGEVLGIIGRNGAGKSTLLKILSRVTAPSSGCVKVKGRIASLLEVGTGFHPDLTGRENIYLNGAILGMTKEEVRRKFDEIVAFAEVEKFIDTPVKRYSSGMYVRLAFAVAAHLESEILLVDEVLAVGDAEFQKKCLGKMGDVASKEGRTVLFVSHNMASIQTLCDDSVLLDKGTVLKKGPTTIVVESYLANSDKNSLYWEIETTLLKEEVYFKRVYVANDQWKPINKISTADIVKVFVEFEIIENVRNLQLSLDLLDNYGNVILVTAPSDIKMELSGKKGIYQYCVSFPMAILLPKQYSIRVNLFTPYYKNFDRVDNIIFFVDEVMAYSNAQTNRLGSIVMLCNWEERLLD